MSASVSSINRYPSSVAHKKKQSSTLKSKNVIVAGRRTSVRLDPLMWDGLTEICERQYATLHSVCTVIAQHKPAKMSLSNAIRVFIVAYFRAAATEEGHTKSGHGSLKAPSQAGVVEQHNAVTAAETLQKIVQYAIG